MYSSFKESIWDADLVDIQLISKFNKGIRFLLCVIDIFSRYTWVIPLKDKGITLTNAVETILHESKHKPNKIWVDKCNEFYNRSMYSKHNERKSVVAGRFIENFKESLSMSKIADIMIIALKVMIKTLNLKLAIVWKYQNIENNKNIFVKSYTLNWSEEVINVPWRYVTDIFNDGKIYKKEFQRTNQIEFRVEKVITKKGNSGKERKTMIISVIAG